jgi:hypothetical protein
MILAPGVALLAGWALILAPPGQGRAGAAPGPPVTRAATCRWTEMPPAIDGKLDDPAWSRAEVIDRFSAFWAGRANDTGTKARLLWDREALYFQATMTDDELRSFGTRRQDHLYKGDVFELFFKPSADRPAYYEYEVNPRSVVMELAFVNGREAYEKVAASTPPAIEAVAIADGTVNQPGDRDRGWRVEGKIPWKAFAATGGRPAPGAAWLFALCRYDYGAEGTKPRTMSSAPLTTPSFHATQDYGRLTFEGPAR